MENIKCECGHANPVGTFLCEACRNPLADDLKGNDAPLDMRYEGAARRSKTHNRTWIDKIWNFFSSVKIAIYMLVIVLISSIFGTIFPQEEYIPVPEPANIFYEKTYGTLGKIYYELGLHNLYSAWWYVTLLLMIGISLVICSIDRVVPLYKALKRQKVKHNLNFLLRQKVSTQIETPGDWDVKLGDLETVLKKRRFHVRREGDALLAEKGRFARWGPYINHVGLIIFLIGALLRLIPGYYMDQYVWIRDGETKRLPETNLYLKSDGFFMDYYKPSEFPEDLGYKDGQRVIKTYRTKAELFENKNALMPGAEPKLQKVETKDILVNHPMEYNGLQLFQAGEKPNMLAALNVSLVTSKTGQEVGKFKIDLFNPKDEYKINKDTKIKVLEYYPDFELTKDKKPSTKSPNPENPAFILDVISPQTPQGEKAWLFLGSYLAAPGQDNVYGYTMDAPEFTNISGLMIRKDKSVPLIYLAYLVCAIGLIMGFYWQHRRIWIQTEKGVVYVSGHTNKNWFGLKREIIGAFKKASVDISLDTKNIN